MNMLWSRETTLTIDINSKEGKYFIEKLIQSNKHVMGCSPNEELGKGWYDYTMHDEDYKRCCDELRKFREGSSM